MQIPCVIMRICFGKQFMRSVTSIFCSKKLRKKGQFLSNNLGVVPCNHSSAINIFQQMFTKNAFRCTMTQKQFMNMSESQPKWMISFSYSLDSFYHGLQKNIFRSFVWIVDLVVTAGAKIIILSPGGVGIHTVCLLY